MYSLLLHLCLCIKSWNKRTGVFSSKKKKKPSLVLSQDGWQSLCCGEECLCFCSVVWAQISTQYCYSNGRLVSLSDVDAASFISCSIFSWSVGEDLCASFFQSLLCIVIDLWTCDDNSAGWWMYGQSLRIIQTFSLQDLLKEWGNDFICPQVCIVILF